MGIHGLTRYCYQNEDSTSTLVEDLHGETLAVDFVGFLYHLCEQLYLEAPADAHLSAPAWLLLGGASSLPTALYTVSMGPDVSVLRSVVVVGCPLRLERWVESWLQRLRARKIRLVFVTDPPQCFGGAEHRKGYCLADRAQQKTDHIDQLSQSLKSLLFEEAPAKATLVEGTEAESVVPPPPSPTQRSKMAKSLLQTNGRFPFAREKLRGVLKKHGIPIKTASREADEELGDLVRTQDAFAVLADDSDFMCMRGVRYIPFKKLTFQQNPQSTEPATILARVFSPDLVAESLGLEVNQLVDLALICGNDLTPMLDNEFDMAASLNFPIQRRQASTSLNPRDAAQWIIGHLPTLENPVLGQIEVAKKGFLRGLFEVYRFYGHSAAFLKKFPMKIEPMLVKKKMNSYKKLVDRLDYPMMAIDILETKSRGLSQRFDPLYELLGREGKSLDGMLATTRFLSYLALNVPVVEELSITSRVEVRMKPWDFMATFLSIPVHARSTKAVDRMFRSLIFMLLYQDPKGGPKASQLAGILGKPDKKGMAVKTIVYSLLVLWKSDRTYLVKASLLNDRLLETFLLASLVCLALDSSKHASTAREPLAFDDRFLNMETYAVVAGYLEALKQVHQLRLVLGNKLPQTSGCASLFSAEVFARVCCSLMQNDGKAKTKKSPKNSSAITREDVNAVAKAFGAEIPDSNQLWVEYAFVRAAMKRLKALITVPTTGVPATGNGKTVVVRALENAVRKGSSLEVDANEQLELDPKAEQFAPVVNVGPAPPLPMGAPPLPPTPFAPPLPPAPPSHLQVSAPSSDPRPVTNLMPSSVAKRLKSESAVTQDTSYVPESEPKEPVSLKGLMETLPVFAHREEILENVSVNQLTIIQGETGCGKSTSVPQFLHDAWARDRASSERPVNIYVTQPRRIAAIELANTVARMREGNEFDEDGAVGKVIGYRIGQKQMTSSKTKITYVTTGYMVERIIHDPEALQSITHLVLDEVHERSMDVDLLLLLLKLQLSDHPHLRLVIMSATMDAKVLIKYLGKALSTRLVNRKPLFVGSKLFPVKNVCLDEFNRWFPNLWQRCNKEMSFMNDQFQTLAQGRMRSKSEMATKAISKVHEKQLVVIEEMVRQLIEAHRNQAGSQ
ncbi:hypothetical protein BBJ28_00022676, partial [Nothophytophthora sp. Chile5]